MRKKIIPRLQSVVRIIYHCMEAAAVPVLFVLNYARHSRWTTAEKDEMVHGILAAIIIAALGECNPTLAWALVSVPTALYLIGVVYQRARHRYC